MHLKNQLFIKHGKMKIKLLKKLKNVGLSWPISRVLSRVIIHLRNRSPCTSSDLPEPSYGPQHLSSYLVLLQVGFTLPFVLPPTRCALTAPFHPYRSTGIHLPSRRYIFCGTVHRLAPSRRYLAPCPVEPGLSSDPEGPAIARRPDAGESSIPTGLRA